MELQCCNYMTCDVVEQLSMTTSCCRRQGDGVPSDCWSTVASYMCSSVRVSKCVRDMANSRERSSSTPAVMMPPVLLAVL